MNVYPLVTISAFFWGANFVLAGFVLADLSPLWAAALRFLLGAAIMFSIAVLRREELFSLARRNAATYLMLGAVGIVAFNLFFFNAMRFTSADNASLIMATNPLLTTLLAMMFLGEKASLRHLVALPLALFGVAVVISQGDLSRLASLRISEGDVLMLAANASWALYNVLSRRYMPKGSATANTAWITASGASILLVVALASGGQFGAIGVKAGMALAVMAAGGSVLAYLFWGMGIVRLGAAKTSIFLNLVPVFAMLLDGIIGTSPTPSQYLGGALVLVGVSISMLPKQKLARAV
ncbi:MAG: DMT family transporter [Burkholderiales bacterium]|nr:DMT family transporter [Burkholderiales bacterium]